MFCYDWRVCVHVLTERFMYMFCYDWKVCLPVLLWLKGSCTCFAMTEVPQWGAADAEIKVQSGENTELKRSPFKAWSRSVYSHTCYANCQGFLSFVLISTLPVHSPAFFSKTSPDFSLCWLWLTHGSCVGLQNKIGHPAGCRFPCWVPAEYK